MAAYISALSIAVYLGLLMLLALQQPASSHDVNLTKVGIKKLK